MNLVNLCVGREQRGVRAHVIVCLLSAIGSVCPPAHLTIISYTLYIVLQVQVQVHS